jgi:hypothetical protein
MYRHFRFGMFLGAVCLLTLQSGEVVAMERTLSGMSDAIGQRSVSVLTSAAAKEPVLRRSVSTPSMPGTPEPGVVALLGFGLVLLGLSYGRSATASGRSHRAIRMSRSPLRRFRNVTRNVTRKGPAI